MKANFSKLPLRVPSKQPWLKKRPSDEAFLVAERNRHNNIRPKITQLHAQNIGYAQYFNPGNENCGVYDPLVFGG